MQQNIGFTHITISGESSQKQAQRTLKVMSILIEALPVLVRTTLILFCHCILHQLSPDQLATPINELHCKESLPRLSQPKRQMQFCNLVVVNTCIQSQLKHVASGPMRTPVAVLSATRQFGANAIFEPSIHNL